MGSDGRHTKGAWVVGHLTMGAGTHCVVSLMLWTLFYFSERMHLFEQPKETVQR